MLWRGTELPVQSAVSRAEVEELSCQRCRKCAAGHSGAISMGCGNFRLTHETGYYNLEGSKTAMVDMDSRVESLDDRPRMLQ